jgi:hypothetical protein
MALREAVGMGDEKEMAECSIWWLALVLEAFIFRF